METTKRSTESKALAEARRRWGPTLVFQQNDRDGLVIAFGGRVSRVTEGVRDISQHKLDRSPTR